MATTIHRGPLKFKVCTYVCLFVRMYSCYNTRMYAFMYVCAYVCMLLCFGPDHSSGSLSKIPWCGSKISPLLMYARIDIYLHVRMYVCTYAYMCVASP